MGIRCASTEPWYNLSHNTNEGLFWQPVLLISCYSFQPPPHLVPAVHSNCIIRGFYMTLMISVACSSLVMLEALCLCVTLKVDSIQEQKNSLDWPLANPIGPNGQCVGTGFWEYGDVQALLHFKCCRQPIMKPQQCEKCLIGPKAHLSWSLKIRAPLLLKACCYKNTHSL